MEDPPSKRPRSETVDGENVISCTEAGSVQDESEFSRNEEKKFGIEVYATDSTIGFKGSIKFRYSDFVVREVDLDGNVAKLTNLEPPPSKDITQAQNQTRDLHSILVEHLTSEQLELIEAINDGTGDQMQIDVTCMDKEKRTTIHKAISASYAKLDSFTSDESSSSTNNTGIARKFINVKRRDSSSRKKDNWPRGRPDYTHFILYKENRDTMDAINSLASMLHTKPSIFSYAGVKDRRAVTCQWVSCWRTEPTRLIAAARRFSRHPRIMIGNFEYKRQALSLGQLKSNLFTIGIRNLSYFPGQDSSSIDLVMKSIQHNGFINYFGLQRFGTFSTRTNEIGLAMLQKKWELAVDLILSYRTTPSDAPGKFNEHDSIIQTWKSSRDPETVLKKFPRFKFTSQGAILKSLARPSHRLNYLGALGALPRNMRTMYVHSYQSLIWNRLSSFRIKQFGLQVIVGDLVIDTTTINNDDIEIFSDDKHVTINNSEKPEERKYKEPSVLVVNESNLHNYSVFDVVIPLIGSRVLIPQGPLQVYLDNLLAEDNITIEDFRSCEKQFSAFGAYRKLLVRPENLSWILTKCTGFSDLVITDILELPENTQERISEAECTDQASQSGQGQKNDINEVKDKKTEPKKRDDELTQTNALIVTFSLPPSAYATMCLREIMKS